MKNILFINGHLNTGGVEKSLIDILKHLDYSKYNVDLLLLEELGDYISEVPDQVHVILHSLKNTYGSFAGSLLRCIQERDSFCFIMRFVFLLMKYVGQERIRLAKKLLTNAQYYDCVIGFRPGICTQIAAFAVNSNKKITWWHHGEINVEYNSYLETANACDRIIVVSESCRSMLAKAFPSLESKMTIIPNMLDVDTIRFKSNAFMPFSQLDIIHIVTLCRLSPEKHIENAVFAAKKIKELGIAFFWHMVGDGNIKNDLRQIAISSGVADVFLFEGNQPNPYPFLKNADLFVHPSYVESQGLVVLEAMALGIPCVVTKSLGPCEFIEDGVNGLLTEQSPESLAQKVIQILTNHKLRTHISAHSYCPNCYLPQNILYKFDSLMEELM